MNCPWLRFWCGMSVFCQDCRLSGVTRESNWGLDDKYHDKESKVINMPNVTAQTLADLQAVVQAVQDSNAAQDATTTSVNALTALQSQVSAAQADVSAKQADQAAKADNALALVTTLFTDLGGNVPAAPVVNSGQS